MQDQENQARSIELAERSLRLRDRATDTSAKEGLHAAANQLIFLNNLNRFYDAQTELEKQNHWLEDYRSLAHELNVADRNLRNTLPIERANIFSTLRDWSRTFIASADQEASAIGHEIIDNLDILSDDSSPSIDEKTALTYLLSVVEVLLEHAALQVPEMIDKKTTDETVILMRLIRDYIIVIRELAYDEDTLLNNYEHEGEQVNRLTIARHTVEMLYSTHLDYTSPNPNQNNYA